MSAEEWERIKEIFSGALALPEPDRPAYIESACGDRKDLLETVAELLASHWDSVTIPPSQGWTPTLAAGELLAERYRVVRFIACGGMGEVYEVYDERLRLRLALKALREELISDKSAQARFERELLIARNVSHDSLCRLFDFVEHHGPAGKVPCLTMELLEGESLAEILTKYRPVSLQKALPWIQQVGAAMATLHERGIIHRDLKPSNIMLARRRNGPELAVVTDFGLAKMKNSECEFFESQVNFQAGAPYFMAPELLKGEEPSIASDIYSFGLLIDEMVTDRRAFSAESLQSLYFAKLWEQPIPPAERAFGLPVRWNDAILRCLEQDPRRRFANIGEVLRNLESGSPSRRPARFTRRAVLVGAAAPAIAGAAAFGLISALPAKAMVGVFDIENRMGKDFEYLCRGTVTELMRRLGALEEIEVVRLYRTHGQSAESPNFRFELGGVLEAQDGQVRLTMQLHDRGSNSLLWSEGFGRRIPQPLGAQLIGNLLELQAEIARHTVVALESALGLVFRMTSATRRRRRGKAFAASTPTISNVAFDYFLRGQMLLQESTPSSVPAAIESFDRAIAEDSGFALAHAALAQAYLAMMNFDQQRTEEFGRKARQSAERGLQADPQLAEAHAAMGAVYQHEWNWQLALQRYDEALRWKPRFPRAMRWRAGLLLQFARSEEAIRDMNQARELDPYDRTSIAGHGLTLLFGGRVLEAIQFLEQNVAGRDMTVARFNLGQAYARYAYLLSNRALSAKFYAKALDEAEEVAMAEKSVLKISTQMFALFHSLKGDRTAADPYVRQMERDVYENGTSGVRLAWIYSVQGDVNRAIGLLERALLIRDSSLGNVRVNPFLENARTHPRFGAILTAMGLT